MTLANGTHVTISPVIAPDLFWALRGGGGGNFGIVTGLLFRLHTWEVDKILAGQIHYDMEKIDAGMWYWIHAFTTVFGV